MKMDKNLSVSLALSALVCVNALGAEKGEVRVSGFVDPFIGTGGNGHTTPAATRPFGMVQPGPDTGNYNWGHCSGYRYEDKTLYGFSQTHLSGTGCGDLGDFLLKPYVLGAPREPLAIDKKTEKASPGYYAVTAGGVACEMTAARCSAVYRFVFPEGSVPKLLVDNQWVIEGWGDRPNAEIIEKARFSASPDRFGFTACHRSNGWAKGRDTYAAAKFSARWTKFEKLPDAPGEAGGRYVFEFPRGMRELEVRIALSRTDEGAAARNLEAETAGRTFAEIRSEAEEEWNSLLGRIEAKGDRDRMKSLYTALYHVFYSPNMISDVGEKPYYSTFSLWDTFRAAHPLYTLLVPERVPGMVDSMLRDGRKRGYLPIWTLWGCETESMIGVHSIPVIVDAYLKGLVPEIDKKQTMELIDRSLSWEMGRRKEGAPLLRRFGYLPADLVEHESVSRTLEIAYDDACAARFAKAIGDREMELKYTKRSTAWRNLFDKNTLFMRPRNHDGTFVEPFSPFRQGYGSGFTEGNSWQYTWHVLHEPETLMAALGGKEAFCDKLEGLFSQPEKVDGMEVVADVTGLIGQYAHGNEPSHHVAFLFALAGRPERTDELVREICTKFYRPTPDGLCGNDDCGQMSAWYIWACLGRYPVDPCGGQFVNFTPIISSAKLKPIQYESRNHD